MNSLETRAAKQLRPSIDSLESRVPPSGVQPTVFEQFYLELLNDARFDPASYGARIGLNLSGVAPSQPLAFNTALIQAARSYSEDSLRNFADNSDAKSVNDRVRAAGYRSTGSAESTGTLRQSSWNGAPYPYPDEASFIAASLADRIIDDGVPNLSDRVTLLDIGGRNVRMHEVGIGLADLHDYRPSQVTEFWTQATTIDLGRTRDSRAFLTGVVFNDGDGDGKYDPGEGLGGVKLRVSGQGTTKTFESGGYSLALRSGIYTVTASGGGLPSAIQRTIVIGAGENTRLNLMPNPNGPTLQVAPHSDQAMTLAMLSNGASRPVAARIDWGDGKASTGDLSDNGQGGFTLSGEHGYAKRGNYEIRALVTKADGSTMAFNALAVVKPDRPG